MHAHAHRDTQSQLFCDGTSFVRKKITVFLFLPSFPCLFIYLLLSSCLRKVSLLSFSCFWKNGQDCFSSRWARAVAVKDIFSVLIQCCFTATTWATRRPWPLTNIFSIYVLMIFNILWCYTDQIYSCFKGIRLRQMRWLSALTDGLSLTLLPWFHWDSSFLLTPNINLDRLQSLSLSLAWSI